MICRIILTRFSVFYVAKIWLVAPSHGLLRLSAPFTFSLHPLRERRRRRQPPANGSPCAVYDVSIFQPAHAGLRELINILLCDVLATSRPPLSVLVWAFLCVMCACLRVCVSCACVFVCCVFACMCAVCLRVVGGTSHACCVCALFVALCTVFCVSCVFCACCVLCFVGVGWFVVCLVCVLCVWCVVCWAYEYVWLFVRAF